MELFDDIWGEKGFLNLSEADNDDEFHNLSTENLLVLPEDNTKEDEEFSMIYDEDQPSENVCFSYGRKEREQEAKTLSVVPIVTEVEGSVGKIQFSTVQNTSCFHLTYKQLMVLSRHHYLWLNILLLLPLACHHDMNRIIPPMQHHRPLSTYSPIP